LRHWHEFGWLCFIHFCIIKIAPDHVVSNAVWNQQLTSVNPREAPIQSFSQPAETQAAGGVVQAGTPEAFGAQDLQMTLKRRCCTYEQSTYSNRTTPSLAPLMFSHFMPGGYQPQSSGAPAFSAAALSALRQTLLPLRYANNRLVPTRVHSANATEWLSAVRSFVRARRRFTGTALNA